MANTTGGRTGNAFTLAELLILISLAPFLAALLVPFLTKSRAAADRAACLSKLGQLHQAWAVYTAENRGRLLEYVWHATETPDQGWDAYWPGMVEQYGSKRETLLCPSAAEPSTRNRGYGSARLAWSGKLAAPGTPVKLTNWIFREGSYGYNRYLTAGNYGPDGTQIVSLAAVKDMSSTPVFLDCVYADTRPHNGSEAAPPAPPPDLEGGAVTAGSPEHWKFLIARHGRGINVVMADGSARRVPLEETYLLTWNSTWVGCRLQLPASGGREKGDKKGTSRRSLEP